MLFGNLEVAKFSLTCEDDMDLPSDTWWSIIPDERSQFTKRKKTSSGTGTNENKRWKEDDEPVGTI